MYGGVVDATRDFDDALGCGERQLSDSYSGRDELPANPSSGIRNTAADFFEPRSDASPTVATYKNSKTMSEVFFRGLLRWQLREASFRLTSTRVRSKLSFLF